jgi:hypothetical protein
MHTRLSPDFQRSSASPGPHIHFPIIISGHRVDMSVPFATQSRSSRSPQSVDMAPCIQLGQPANFSATCLVLMVLAGGRHGRRSAAERPAGCISAAGPSCGDRKVCSARAGTLCYGGMRLLDAGSRRWHSRAGRAPADHADPQPRGGRFLRCVIGMAPLPESTCSSVHSHPCIHAASICRGPHQSVHAGAVRIAVVSCSRC